MGIYIAWTQGRYHCNLPRNYNFFQGSVLTAVLYILCILTMMHTIIVIMSNIWTIVVSTGPWCLPFSRAKPSWLRSVPCTTAAGCQCIAPSSVTGSANKQCVADTATVNASSVIEWKHCGLPLPGIQAIPFCYFLVGWLKLLYFHTRTAGTQVDQIYLCVTCFISPKPPLLQSKNIYNIILSQPNTLRAGMPIPTKSYRDDRTITNSKIVSYLSNFDWLSQLWIPNRSEFMRIKKSSCYKIFPCVWVCTYLFSK